MSAQNREFVGQEGIIPVSNGAAEFGSFSMSSALRPWIRCLSAELRMLGSPSGVLGGTMCGVVGVLSSSFFDAAVEFALMPACRRLWFKIRLYI